jgi:glycosyltransferase involved in cell wall biosynthesis
VRVLVDALAARYGGALTYIRSQLSALVRVRPDLDVTALVLPVTKEVFERIPGLKVESVRWVNSVPVRVLFEQSVLPLRARGRFDVLYCPGNFTPLFSGTPRVVAEQSPRYFGSGRELTRGLRYRTEARLAYASIARAKAVVVISHALLSEMEQDGLDTRRCVIMPSGAPRVASEGTEPDGFPASAPFFLVLASDYVHKRLDDAVLAWREVVSNGSPRLVIAGGVSSGRRDHLSALVPPGSRASLLLLGQVSDPANVRWLLENALALVATSDLEACPLTPGEAGAVGCPLILSDIPPHREVTEGRGRFFPVGDVHALAASMRDVLREPPDRTAWSWPVSWDDNARQLGSLLDEVSRGQSVGP